MRHKLIIALLAAITAGTASAQLAGSSGSDTSAPPARLIAAQRDPSTGNDADTFQPGPATDQPDSLGLSPVSVEALNQETNPWPSDKMALDQMESGPFLDPDAVRREGAAFLREFDLLRGDTHESPVSIGRDKDIKFVESHDNRPGIPAPIGMAYPLPQRRVRFFVEVAPILDPSPTTALGWGGGIGVSIYFGR